MARRFSYKEVSAAQAAEVLFTWWQHEDPMVVDNIDGGECGREVNGRPSVKGIRKSFNAAKYEKWHCTDSVCFVAFDGETGFAHVAVKPRVILATGEKVARCHQAYVAAPFRSQGHGAALIRFACETFAARYPDTAIEGLLAERNEGVQNLAQRCGFELRNPHYGLLGVNGDVPFQLWRLKGTPATERGALHPRVLVIFAAVSVACLVAWRRYNRR